MMNTANKRASAIGIGLALRLVLPIPDGTIQFGDRQQVAYSYAGIHANAPILAPSEIVTTGPVSIRRRVNVAPVTIHRTVAVSPVEMRRRITIEVER